MFLPYWLTDRWMDGLTDGQTKWIIKILIYKKFSIGESWDEWTWSDGSKNDWPEFSNYWQEGNPSGGKEDKICMVQDGNNDISGYFYSLKFICKVTCPNSTNWSKNYGLCKFNFSLVFD